MQEVRSHPYVIQDEKISGGSAVIKGTRTRVVDIAYVDFLRMALDREQHCGIIYVHQRKVSVGGCVRRLKSLRSDVSSDVPVSLIADPTNIPNDSLHACLLYCCNPFKMCLACLNLFFQNREIRSKCYANAGRKNCQNKYQG